MRTTQPGVLVRRASAALSIASVAAALAGCDRAPAVTDASVPSVPHVTVGADGGTACVGALCFDIPAGGAAGPVDLTVTPVLLADAGVPALGPVYDITASVPGFADDLTVRFPLPPGTRAADLAVTFRTGPGQPWQSIASRPAADGASVEVTTGHLSQWAIIPQSASAAQIDRIAFDAQRRIYTFESAAGRITRIDDPSGAGSRTLTAIGGTSLAGATGFALDPSGRLYVLAYRDRLLLRANDIAGNGPASGNLGGTGFPFRSGALFVDAASHVYTAYDSRIEVADDLDGTNTVHNQHVCRWVTVPAYSGGTDHRGTGQGGGSCLAGRTTGAIAVDSHGRIVASDISGGFVARANDLEGSGVVFHVEPGDPPDATRPLVPTGVGIDPQDRVVIAYDGLVVRIDDFPDTGRTVLWQGTEPVTALTVGPHGELAFATQAASGPSLHVDECPDDPNKSVRGFCGCGAPENPTDSDGDGVPDCADTSPAMPCECFALADVQRARQASGAECVQNRSLLQPSRATGVLRTDGAATYLYGVRALRSGTWECSTGCVSGCTPVTSHDIVDQSYQACLNVASVGCGF